MRLYLDDDSSSVLLADLLRQAAHDVQRPADADIAGEDDSVHLAHAARQDRVLLTHNYHDFENLHDLVVAVAGHHPGILVVRKDNDPRRDLTVRGIVRAIGKLLSAGVGIANEYIVLNHWRREHFLAWLGPIPGVVDIVASIALLYADGMSMNSNQYQYLAPKPGSNYRHLFIKDRWISARTLYGKYAREEEPMTPEEIAADYDLPLDAVREAIAYCESNPPELAQDYAREEAWMEATGMNDPNYDGRPRLLTAEEIARLKKL